MNTRILKHINRADIENGYDFPCDVSLGVNLDMKNNEGEIKHFKPQTKKIKIQLKNGADRERLFKKIEEEWNGVYNKFGYRGNNPLVNISEDVLNPEISMNREDYNEKNSWDYWFIYSIKNFELDIQFTYNENDPTHKPQVMKGPIEYFIDGKRVSSEEWKQDKDEEDEEEPNPKRTRPRKEDGKNKRLKANARRKHSKRGGFYFDPPSFMKNSKSGCICVDDKGGRCLQYAIEAVLHPSTSGHPSRHKQYEQYFKEHNWRGMNFPSSYKDLETFCKNNPDILLKVYSQTGSKNTTKKQLFPLRPYYFPRLTPEEMKGKTVVYLLLLFPPQEVINARLKNNDYDIGHFIAIRDINAFMGGLEK